MSRPHGRMIIICRHCGEADTRLGGRGLCRACYQFEWANGYPRPERYWQNLVNTCPDCGRRRENAGHGYCRRDYMRHWRRGEFKRAA